MKVLLLKTVNSFLEFLDLILRLPACHQLSRKKEKLAVMISKNIHLVLGLFMNKTNIKKKKTHNITTEVKLPKGLFW